MTKKILMFVEDHYEDMELHYPRIRMTEAGFKVVIAGPKKEEYKGKHGVPCKADITFKEVSEKDYVGLIIPGGYAPDLLRTDKSALEITRHFVKEKKLLAFICHAGWVPISANVLKGKKCTSYIAIKDDMINAGVDWKDEPVVVDHNIITSRFPDDLPHFCTEILKFLKSHV